MYPSMGKMFAFQRKDLKNDEVRDAAGIRKRNELRPLGVANTDSRILSSIVASLLAKTCQKSCEVYQNGFKQLPNMSKESPKKTSQKCQQ